MVSISKRITKLQTLLNIRLGPGAAILPRAVTKIHLDFGFKIYGGHKGARAFWRQMLPRLKYHNPAVQMTVNRQDNNEKETDLPAFMNIYINKNIERESPLTANPFTETIAPFQPALNANQIDKPTRLIKTSLRTPEADPIERIHQIDMRHKSEGSIWQEVQALTGAVSVAPSPAEIQTLEELKEQKKKAEISSERGKQIRAALKKEQDMLKAAADQYAASRQEEAGP